MKENTTWAEGDGYDDPRVPGMSRRPACAAKKPRDQVPLPCHVSCRARALSDPTAIQKEEEMHQIKSEAAKKKKKKSLHWSCG